MGLIASDRGTTAQEADSSYHQQFPCLVSIGYHVSRVIALNPRNLASRPLGRACSGTVSSRIAECRLALHVFLKISACTDDMPMSNCSRRDLRGSYVKNKTRFIPLVIIGAVLLSLLAIVPAFGADEVGFIDPGDINPSGTLSDSTPDDQEWARQGGRIGLTLSDDGLDTPVKRVLIPSIDATMSGSGDVDAHMDTISDASVSGVSGDDYILIGMNTVRKVESVTRTDGNTTITVDKAFASGMSNAMIYRINDSVTDLDPWDDNYASYAMAEMIGTGQATYRATGSVSRYNAQHAIVDSDVGKNSGTTPLDRISGSPTGTVNTADVLVVKVSSTNNAATAIDVADVSGDRIEMEDVSGASSADPLGLGGDSAYLVYWAEERNETGSAVTVRSQAHQDPVTAVLTETTPNSGEFVLEIMTVMPQDADGDDIMPDFSASVPTLPVNPHDVVTLSGDDSTATLSVETTQPVFSGFSPAHNTVGRDNRPEVTARVADRESGLTEGNIYVIFRIAEGAAARTIVLRPESDGEVKIAPPGFEIRQRITGSYAPSGDATIEWWVKAVDNAGNVGYSDRQSLVDGEENPCTADGDTALTRLEDAGCQPFRIIVSEVMSCGPGLPSCTGPTVSMSVASTGIRVRINSPIPMTSTFSRPVSVFTINDISVVNGTAGNFVGSDGDRVYSFDVVPTAIGDVTVDISAGTSVDSDGNGNLAALQLSLGIPYDDDGDGAISRDEVIAAIGDYLFNGLLTRDQVIALISLYLFG